MNHCGNTYEFVRKHINEERDSLLMNHTALITVASFGIGK